MIDPLVRELTEGIEEPSPLENSMATMRESFQPDIEGYKQDLLGMKEINLVSCRKCERDNGITEKIIVKMKKGLEDELALGKSIGATGAILPLRLESALVEHEIPRVQNKIVETPEGGKPLVEIYKEYQAELFSIDNNPREICRREIDLYGLRRDSYLKVMQDPKYTDSEYITKGVSNLERYDQMRKGWGQTLKDCGPEKVSSIN